MRYLKQSNSERNKEWYCQGLGRGRNREIVFNGQSFSLERWKKFVVPEATKVTMKKQREKPTKYNFQQGSSVLITQGIKYCSRLADGENYVCLVKAMVFPVVRYGCESWTVKKVERQTIDAFELWCWRRLLRVPWTSRRSNQYIVKEISPGCFLEGMMLRLKLQFFGHLM